MRLRIIGFALLGILITAPSATAQDNNRTLAGSKFFAPFGAVASPSGRWGETDTKANPPKTGHKTGFAGGVDVGYFLSEQAAIGIAIDYAQFDLDFGDLASTFKTDVARTSLLMGQVWARIYLPRGFNRWRPYIVVGVGAGKPKSKAEFPDPIPFQIDSVTTVFLAKQNSSVDLSFGIMAGVGFMIPILDRVSAVVEPRYRSFSVSGKGRTDTFTLDDGSVTKEPDTAKSNMNWWEVRGGLIITAF